MRSTRIVLTVLVMFLGPCLTACRTEAPASGGNVPAAPPDVSAVPADAQRSASGLAWKVLQAGTGTRHPRPNSEVTVHYTGWTTDGQMFDSSLTRGEAATFTLDGVIRGWTEGVQMMVQGEKRRFWVPAELAYGHSGDGGPKGMLVFDIELVKIGS